VGPVTHTALVDVNNAVTKSNGASSAREIGKLNTSAPTPINPAKRNSNIRSGFAKKVVARN
jgi:hypothetical protein